jgi:ubiquitin carboxyl-terminal hydrolase 9/24
MYNPKNFLDALQFLSKFHLVGQWRTKRLNDWLITPKMNEKSSTGYVGIKNLGCICYMNSFLQQIFMIPSFREAVFAVDDPQFSKLKQEDNLLYQLKILFVALEKSEQQYYVPKGFTHSFKDYEGKPINTSEQMDIDEFSGVMFDRLENQVKGVTHENFIKEHFGGIISNEIISKGCQHYSER